MSKLQITGVKKSNNKDFVVLHLEQDIDISKAKGHQQSSAMAFAGFENKTSRYHHWTTIKKENAINLAPTLKEILSTPPSETTNVSVTSVLDHPKGQWNLLVFESTDINEIIKLNGPTYVPKPKEYKGKLMLKDGLPIYMATIIAIEGDGQKHQFVQHDK